MLRFISLVAFFVLLFSFGANAQEIAGGGSATFFTKGGKTEEVGDIFAEAAWTVNIENTDRYVMISALGGYGESGDGFVGLGGRHFWKVAPGIYPAAGAQLFYLNGGDLDSLFETTIFAGPEASCEFLAENLDLSIMPFIGWYPALAGDDDSNIFRFGIRLNEAGAQ